MYVGVVVHYANVSTWAFTHLESFPNRIILLYPEDEVFVLAIISLNIYIHIFANI